MKTLLALLLGVAPVAFAQPVAVGVRGGIPLTDFVTTTTSPNPSVGSFFGTRTNRYIIGPTLELYLPFGFGVEIDGLYRHLDYTQHGTVLNNVVSSAKASANAWEFPLLAKYRFPFPVIKPFIDGGVNFDTLSSLKNAALDVLPTGDTITVHHQVIYGLAVGGGLDLRLAMIHFIPEIRYTRWGTEHFRDANDLIRWNKNEGEFLLGITFGGAPR